MDLKHICFILKDARVIAGYLEDDVTLQCGDSLGWMDLMESYRGRWIKYLNNSQQLIVSQHEKWMPGADMPLKLSKLKESHEGVYSCEIWRGWDCVHKRNINSKVSFAITFTPFYFPAKKYTSVVCLWSRPLSECKFEGGLNVPFGSSFKMKCPVNELWGAPSNISWFLLNAGTPGPVRSERAKEEGLLLHFHSVDDRDGRWYRCKYNIGGTKRCFEFNLQTKSKFFLFFFKTLVSLKLHTFQWKAVVSLVTLCSGCLLLPPRDGYHCETQYSGREERRKPGSCGPVPNGGCCSCRADWTSCYSEVCPQEICSTAWEPAARSVLCYDSTLFHRPALDWLEPPFLSLTDTVSHSSMRVWTCSRHKVSKFLLSLPYVVIAHFTLLTTFFGFFCPSVTSKMEMVQIVYTFAHFYWCLLVPGHLITLMSFF